MEIAMVRTRVSMLTSNHTPSGWATIEATAIVPTNRQFTHRRVSRNSMMPIGSSIAMTSGTICSAVSNAAITGASISAEPNPAKPRIIPATKATRSAQTKRPAGSFSNSPPEKKLEKWERIPSMTACLALIAPPDYRWLCR